LGLICSFILYFIIAVYLDNVLPQGNNLHKKWHFFITDLFKSKKEKSFENYNNNNDNNNPYIQEDPKGMKRAVEIKNISKSFKVKRETIEILKNIKFNGYYNEIFAILGHNGAGKTTLMNIMTGILSSTRGEVYYDSVPISGNETDICSQFGYCPQFDTFDNNLNVGEHIKLFSGIKGITVDVDSILQDINLLSKKEQYPKELSGGQRRKLCITLALLGSPKYVFLDEPTTGLDPYSRKNIWELLSRKKEGRIIFVTTHYMDEADLLADRKMIISNGNISCLGSSLFLKQQFNMNYSLDVNCQNVQDCTYFEKTLTWYCPGSVETKKISNTNMQTMNGGDHLSVGDYLITYLLPMKYSKNFKEIFKILNSIIKDERNSIKNFSLTAPTLEELFIKLERKDEMNMNDQCQTQQATPSTMIDMNSEVGLTEKLEPVFGKRAINESSSLRQILAIIKLRLTIFIRNKTSALLYGLLPVLLTILCIYLVHTLINMEGEVRKFKPLDLTPSIYNNEPWFKEANLTNPALDYINCISSANHLNLDTVSFKDDLSISSGKDLSLYNYVGGFYGYQEEEGLRFIIYKNYTDVYTIPIAVNLLSNSILEKNNIKERFSVTYHPLDYIIGRDDKNSENDVKSFIDLDKEYSKKEKEPILIICISVCISLSISIFGPYTVKEREEGITHQLFLNGTKKINYWLGVLISDFICIFVPVMIISIAGYLNEVSIYHPKIIGFTLIMTIVWIIGCLLQQYVICFFFKKYDRASTVLVILNPLITLLSAIKILGTTILFDLDINEINNPREKKEIQDEIIAMYIVYAITFFVVPGFIILLYYKLSTFLNSKFTEINSDKVSEFLLTDKAQSILSNAKLSNSEKVKLLKEAFLSPLYSSIKNVFQCKDKFIILVIMVIAMVLVYGSILYILEMVKKRRLHKNSEYTPKERSIKDKIISNGPIDVRNEWQRVGQSLKDGKSNIVLKVFQLSKDFGMKRKEIKRIQKEKTQNEKEAMVVKVEERKGKEHHNNKKNKKKDRKKKSAFEKMDYRMVYDENKKKYVNRIVDDVTFGVNSSECLGLLGPNGAGKTTTISMITDLLSRSHGDVYYGQKELIQTEMANLSLGYCSQHDSLWKLLTVRETIEFYLNICGYPRKEIRRYSKALIEACGIESHTNKKVKEISGGTKRKLSLIIAICSSPSYLILDEPSAGMDPFTRRYMWQLIKELKKVRETANILTSHSTEEAEALCDRIAILIKGRLVCIDTARSIKMNHSDKYTLEVFTSNVSQFEEEFVKKQNLFGLDSITDYEVESSINYQKYSVNMKIENIARVFEMMEYAKDYGLVTQYNFGQYSLEQVFINFVNNSK